MTDEHECGTIWLPETRPGDIILCLDCMTRHVIPEEKSDD